MKLKLLLINALIIIVVLSSRVQAHHDVTVDDIKIDDDVTVSQGEDAFICEGVDVVFSIRTDSANTSCDDPRETGCSIDSTRYLWEATGGTPSSGAGTAVSGSDLLEFKCKFNSIDSTSDITINAYCDHNDKGYTTINIKEAVVDEIQYDHPTTGWTNVTGTTLYVPKGGPGDTIALKAIPDPSTASLPSEQTEWSWSGCPSPNPTGTTVDFPIEEESLLSSGTTVTVDCCSSGEEKQVTIVVFEGLIVTPDPGHVGVNETLVFKAMWDAGSGVAQDVSTSSDTKFSVTTGGGDFTSAGTVNTYTAGSTAETCTVKGEYDEDGDDTYDVDDTAQVEVVVIKTRFTCFGEDTTINSNNNYSEDAIIELEVIDAATTMPLDWYTGTVNIAEKEEGIDSYIPIYTQNASYNVSEPLPISITFVESDNGVKEFTAKSLAAGKSPTERPDPAEITSTNYETWDGNYCSIPQWVDNDPIHDLCQGGVEYDWFETMVKDIMADASEDDDVETVLGKIEKYVIDTSMSDPGGATKGHTAQSVVYFNPCYNSNMRVNKGPESNCGYTTNKMVTFVVLHEARHCYQYYLTTENTIGSDDDSDANTPSNDDDQDYLVDSVPIEPNNFLLDNGDSRSTCFGTESFSGDNSADDAGTAADIGEKDARDFADQHDD